MVRALLTGGRGFVGARLAATLNARHPDWRVDSPDRDPAPGAPEDPRRHGCERR